MEAATSTNTGNKRIETLLALAVRGGKRTLALLGLLQNRAVATTVSGTTVAAGTAMVATTLTPQYTGKVRVSWFASWAAPGAVTVTPVLIEAPAGGSTHAFAAFAQTGNVVGDIGGAMELDGFAIGVAVGFTLNTTAGDGTITLGQGVATAGAGITVEELP